MRLTLSHMDLLRFLAGGLVAFCLSFAALAQTQTGIQQVDVLLSAEQAPEGVVFEIVSRDSDRLQKVLPRVQKAVAALRAKFPELDITVVSHGREQFALMKNQQSQQPEAHQQVRSLLGENVQLHVCGTFASMKGVEAEAFPDYVDVAAHGPELIKDYVELGYQQIRVR